MISMGTYAARRGMTGSQDKWLLRNDIAKMRQIQSVKIGKSYRATAAFTIS